MHVPRAVRPDTSIYQQLYAVVYLNPISVCVCVLRILGVVYKSKHARFPSSAVTLVDHQDDMSHGVRGVFERPKPLHLEAVGNHHEGGPLESTLCTLRFNENIKFIIITTTIVYGGVNGQWQDESRVSTRADSTTH